MCRMWPNRSPAERLSLPQFLRPNPGKGLSSLGNSIILNSVSCLYWAAEGDHFCEPQPRSHFYKQNFYPS
ncbi:hypothetical protein VN97_g91 [Penicillium thymicola]|uniref:Uncharacterized protein n=1 Tax=Penicillium thymicola TaxID=293382 RepID=A0AAI9XDS2_PENTH|nr:hypothetical protein VN97_g91 [Penicillium thymicola]